MRILSTLVVLGACASTSGGGAPQMLAIDPPLPVAAFIDSAALHHALLGAPRVPAGFTRQPLFRVAYDSTGALTKVEPMSDLAIPPVWGDTIAAILRRHVAPRLTTTKPVVQFVSLVSGPSPRIAVIDDFVEERPQLLNGAEVSRAIDAIAARLGDSRVHDRGRQFRAVLSVRVDQQGRAGTAALRRSTGNEEVNREILSLAATMRFQPAQLSGHPVAVMVSIPVTIVIPPSETGSVTTPRRRGPG